MKLKIKTVIELKDEDGDIKITLHGQPYYVATDDPFHEHYEATGLDENDNTWIIKYYDINHETKEPDLNNPCLYANFIPYKNLEEK